jgi:dienelactone hydrolase
LPDPLIFPDGRRIASSADWPARRSELLGQLVDLAYGPLPPRPEAVSVVPLHTHTALKDDKARATAFRLTATPPGFSFLLLLVTPPGDGPFPVVINGDGCWLRTLSQEILSSVIQRGYAAAIFNRVEIAADNAETYRKTGLPALLLDRCPPALAAWTWGFHRVVDALLQLPVIDPKGIAATGHSRGGKTALLAGATDERIALTAPNNSGCGGAGCFRVPDEGAETLSRIVTVFPHWFSGRLNAFAGREQDLPFDLHSLKACVAPRLLLSTEARGDTWASPHGTRLTFEAAREVYRFLGAEDRIGICFRDGGHAHLPEDWEKLLDFADHHFAGKPPARDFDMRP